MCVPWYMFGGPRTQSSPSTLFETLSFIVPHYAYQATWPVIFWGILLSPQLMLLEH